jgi:hypothetical protein
MLPPEIERFIADRIDSVGLLEVLVLLASDRERAWSAPEASAALRSGRRWAEAQLEHLRAERLLVVEPGDEPRYRYRPARPELEAQVERLLQAFESNRAGVIKLVFSQRPRERRTDD